ncbi:MAG: lipocalin family protein [Bacteroidales bacterium]
METKTLKTVEKVDLEKYMGKWYDIAHFPAAFLNGCENITAEYSLTDKNFVRVYNRCVKTNTGKVKSIKGKAFKVKGSDNTKFKVQFFWPFRADYWILEIDPDYQYAAIGGPSRTYAWILSRTPDLDEEIINSLLELLKEKGFEVENMERTRHTEPTPES